MSRLPIVNYKTVNKLLLKLGFEIVRQKGIHVF
jgi:predicted RNA binding protein YcfA (HicA-like mRNA interferase family)